MITINSPKPLLDAEIAKMQGQFEHWSKEDVIGFIKSRTDFSDIGKVDKGMLKLGYDFSPKKALKQVAEYFNIPETDINMAKHKYGGTMFFASYHNQKELYKKFSQLGAVSPRRKEQKGTVFSGSLWVSVEREDR